MNPFFRGVFDSLPIGLGYIPISFSFGLAALHANLSPLSTIAISAFIFAGASQFVLITLIASGGSALSTISAVLLMNIRHLFYGPALMGKIANTQKKLPFALLAFGLTDEVFAAAIGKIDSLPTENRQQWFVGLQFGSYLAWIFGTILGVFLGEKLMGNSPIINRMLGFVLPALFFTLLLELLGHFRLRILIGTLIATSLLLLFTPAHFAMLSGMLFGAFLDGVEKNHGN